MLNKLFISIVMLGALLDAATLHAQNYKLKTQSDIATVVDIFKKGETDRLSPEDIKQILDLPIAALPIMADELNTIPIDASDRPLYNILAMKFNQYEDQLHEPELSQVINALLARTTIGELSDQKRKAMDLSGIKSRRIKDVVIKINGGQKQSTVSQADSGSLFQSKQNFVQPFPTVEPITTAVSPKASSFVWIICALTVLAALGPLIFVLRRK